MSDVEYMPRARINQVVRLIDQKANPPVFALREGIQQGAAVVEPVVDVSDDDVRPAHQLLNMQCRTDGHALQR